MLLRITEVSSIFEYTELNYTFMELDNFVAYHIRRALKNEGQDWSPDDIIDFGFSENNYKKTLFGLDLSCPHHSTRSFVNAVNDMNKKVESRSYKPHDLWNLYNFGNFALNRTTTMLREMVF